MNPQPNLPAPIPTPPAVRWHEFRIRAIPMVVFLVVAAAAAIMWQRNFVPVTMTGRIETVQANVSSPKPGQLSQLRVTRFQKVAAGDPVVLVITTDPRELQASLAVIQAEVELIRATKAPIVNSERSAMNYEQMQMGWMRQRVDLATARVNQQLAESEFERVEKVFKDKLVTDSEYDIARAQMQALRVEVQEKEKLVKATEQSIQRLRPALESASEPERQLRAAIAVQEEKLKLTEAQLSPITLKAPIEGTVSIIHRYNGESVAAGEPIVTISAIQTDRIIGWLPQPLYFTPEKDMTVRVKTRGQGRLQGTGKVLAVGAQLQPLNDMFTPPTRYNNLVQLGLPILISLPNEFKVPAGQTLLVHPGELVDLTIVPQKP